MKKIIQIGKLISYCHILSELTALDQRFWDDEKPMRRATLALESAIATFWIIAHKTQTPYPHDLA